MRLEFTLPATVATVYRCWTDVELLSRWMGPSPGRRAEVCVDLRVGGRYRFSMGARASSGEYLIVEPPSHLRFTWVWDDEPEVETEVDVTLAPVGPDGAHTHMVLEHSRLPLEVDCLGFETGWRMTAAKLLELLASAVVPGVATEARPGTEGAPTSPVRSGS